MNRIVNILKALGDENRLKILFMLREKNMCACEMLELLDITGATLSAHLKILKLNGIIDSEKDGRWIEYSLADATARRFVDFIEDTSADSSAIKEMRRKIRSLGKREAICRKR